MHPQKIFNSWLKQAIQSKDPLSEVMFLATSSKNLNVSLRPLLYKGQGKSDFCIRFFTNYSSRKSQQLRENSKAAITFYWPQIDKVIRLEGKIVKTTRQESVDYFKSRPRKSQIGAWASLQSKPLSARGELTKRLNLIAKQFKNREIPCPSNWGGFNLYPKKVEFWKAHPNRWHYRQIFIFKNNSWSSSLLFP